MIIARCRLSCTDELSAKVSTRPKKSWLLLWVVILAFLTLGTASEANAQQRQVEYVDAVGVGRDVAEASQNAAQNALTNVVGSFMDSNTTLNKKTEINEGIKKQSKLIQKDIKEYSQGVIQSFDVVSATTNNGLTTVKARVGVRIEDFKVYVKKLAEASVEVNSGLFAKIKTEEKQNKNIAEILYDKILSPLVDGSGVDFLVSEPRLLREMNLQSVDLSKYVNGNANYTIVGFYVVAKTKDGLFGNIRKTLDSISKSRTPIKPQPEVNWNFDFYQALGSMGNFDYQQDIFVALAAKQPGSNSKFLDSITGYVLNGGRVNLSRSKNWAGSLLSSGFSNAPITPLQLELLGQDDIVLLRENTYSDNSFLSSSGRMKILSDKSDFFTAPWSLAGGYSKGGHTWFAVREFSTFIVLLAVDSNQMKSVQKITIRLNK